MKQSELLALHAAERCHAVLEELAATEPWDDLIDHALKMCSDIQDHYDDDKAASMQRA
jgi:hypothetical protein